LSFSIAPLTSLARPAGKLAGIAQGVQFRAAGARAGALLLAATVLIGVKAAGAAT
jgi:hypothetical protein